MFTCKYGHVKVQQLLRDREKMRKNNIYRKTEREDRIEREREYLREKINRSREREI